MNLDMLASLVDEQVHTPAADRAGSARLYGVRLVVPPRTFQDGAFRPGASQDRARGAGGGGPTPEVLLDELGRGDARELPRRARPPAGLTAIALATTAWAAPMDDGLSPGGAAVRPSRHPQRRRMHVTFLVGGDGEDVSVLREPGREPLVVRDGAGVVRDLLVRCWNRRRDAPPATPPPDRPARPTG